GVKVLINGKSQGTFSPVNRIVAFGQAGNDNIQVAGGIKVSAWLYGGAGNDPLPGGGGHDVLTGRDWDAPLVGVTCSDRGIWGRAPPATIGPSPTRRRTR